MLKWLWLSLLVVITDQLTKWLAVEYLAERPPIEIFSWFDLQLVYNKGAAFGMLSEAGGWQTYLFTVVAIVVCAGLIYYIGRLKANEFQVVIAFSLILGGAVGNLIDRLYQGYVVDFIHWYYQDWHWPNFNIADSAITIGAVLLVMDAVGWRLLKVRER